MHRHIFQRGLVRLSRVTVDMRKGQVVGPQHTYQLSDVECTLLRVFMLSVDQVVPRILLMKVIPERQAINDPKVLYPYIRSLRRKIEPNPKNPRYLKTVHGKGYRFVLD